MQAVIESLPVPGETTGPHVAVIGGGASGVLTAINLLAAGGSDLRVTLFESAPQVGTGIAYGTTDARHLLNVRARHMSALPDVPSDLIDWAAARGEPVDRTAFLPRRDYACYLRDRLQEVADDRLDVVRARVTDLVPTAGGYDVHTDATTPVRATSVVLATGNNAPRPLTVAEQELPADASWHVANPWDLGWLDALTEDATVVLVGTGLTAVDTAISVLDGHPRRRVAMTSRNGKLPRSHVDQQSTAWVSPVPTGELTADRLASFFVGQIGAAERQGVNWRNVVDGLRAPTQSIWLRLPTDERRRFLARYGREWEVRRHRMAPEVAARLDDLERDGRLRVVSGGIRAVEETTSGCRVHLADHWDWVDATAVVNCTGPETDASRSSDPLVLALLERGLVAPDELRLGLDCTPDGRILDASGAVVPGLFAVGPPRKSTLYESTAVPEIRAQAAQVAALVPAGS